MYEYKIDKDNRYDHMSNDEVKRIYNELKEKKSDLLYMYERMKKKVQNLEKNTNVQNYLHLKETDAVRTYVLEQMDLDYLNSRMIEIELKLKEIDQRLCHHNILYKIKEHENHFLDYHNVTCKCIKCGREIERKLQDFDPNSIINFDDHKSYYGKEEYLQLKNIFDKRFMYKKESKTSDDNIIVCLKNSLEKIRGNKIEVHHTENNPKNHVKKRNRRLRKRN